MPVYYAIYTAPSMVPLHSLGQDDQNDVQHNFFGHVISLASALYLCNAVNDTIAFFTSEKSMRCNMNFWSLTPLAPLLAANDSNITLLRST